MLSAQPRFPFRRAHADGAGRDRQPKLDDAGGGDGRRVSAAAGDGGGGGGHGRGSGHGDGGEPVRAATGELRWGGRRWGVAGAAVLGVPSPSAHVSVL